VKGLTTGAPLVVQVEKNGYLPWSSLVDLGQLANPERVARLRNLPKNEANWGKVVVKTRLPCDIFVNGKAVGHVTTTGPLSLPEGTVELTMVAASGATARRVVNVPGGKTVEETVELP